jgi:hypothetical protein
LRFIPARIPCILEPEGSSKEYRKNWARLIQKFTRLIPELSQTLRLHSTVKKTS